MTKTSNTHPPSLFLPHGAPDLAIAKNDASDYLKALSERLPEITGIIIISAHWETRGLYLTTADRLDTIYDFGGFDEALRSIHYPAKTASWLIKALRDQLEQTGHTVQNETHRGLDHGAWVPLSLAFPDADIPTVGLSLDRTMSPDQLIDLGRALAPLKEKGILIIGSGGLVHNLRDLDFAQGPTPDWASTFDQWLDEVIEHEDLEALTDYRSRAPHAVRAHPTDEHLLPLLIALGAGGEGSKPEKWHSSFTYGSISMASWAFT